jgi:hypothetical protein
MHVTLWWCSRLTIIHDRLGAIWWWELQLNYANAVTIMYCPFIIKVWLMKYNLLKRMTQNSYTSLMLKQLNGTNISWELNGTNISWEALSEKKIDASLLVSWNTVYLSVKSSSYRYDYCSQNSVLLNIVINSGNKRDGFRNIRFEGKKK